MPCNDGSCDTAIWFNKIQKNWRIGEKSRIGKLPTSDEIYTCNIGGNQNKCPYVSGPPYKNGLVWTYETLGGWRDRTTTEVKVKCTSFTNGK